MNYNILMTNIENIKSKLLDTESVVLFDAKVNHLISRDCKEFEKTIFSLEKNWKCNELNNALLRKKFKGIILYGCGGDGEFNYNLLKKCGYKVNYFCRTTPDENEKYNVSVS